MYILFVFQFSTFMFKTDDFTWSNEAILGFRLPQVYPNSNEDEFFCIF